MLGIEYQPPIDQLQILLATVQVLQTKTQYYHWNVTGIHFQSLHAFFEEQYSFYFETLDTVAERIRALGKPVTASLEYYKKTSIIADSTTETNAEAMLKAYKTDLSIMIEWLYDAIDTCDDADEVGTEDYLTGLLQEIQKRHWMTSSLLA